MADFPVKWYDDRFYGAPILSGTPGSLIGLLDAMLVDGFGDTGIISITVADGLATIILADGNYYHKWAVVELKGMVDPLLNKEYRVKDGENGRVVVEMDHLDGPVDINPEATIRYPSLGWFKPFSGVNMGVYKPSPADAKNWYLWVDDTGAYDAVVKICEKVNSITSIELERPKNVNSYWSKSYDANTNARNYNLVGDSYCFWYKMPQNYTFYSASYLSYIDGRENNNLKFVGEGVPLTNDDGDPFNVYLTYRNTVRSVAGGYGFYNALNNIAYSVVLRDSMANKRNYTFTRSEMRDLVQNTIFNNDNRLNADQSIILNYNHYFVDNSRRYNKIPGLVTANTFPIYNDFSHVIEAKDNTIGRDLINFNSSNSLSIPQTEHEQNLERGFFDITGPWR